MSSIDPIADLLTRIRNAHQAKHDRVDIPASRMKLGICRILEQEGFVGPVEVIDDEPNDVMRISLNYTPTGEPVILHLQRVSRGGRRVYRKAQEIRPVLAGIGMEIISTSQGLVTDAQARELGIGGEVICQVW
jgi:small subunit ribosomal protein S8